MVTELRVISPTKYGLIRVRGSSIFSSLKHRDVIQRPPDAVAGGGTAGT
jgi:hypothetical protein